MTTLADASDGDELRERLGQPLLELFGADTYVSLVWNASNERFERAKGTNISPKSLQAWDDYYHRVDPLTLPLFNRRRPTIATQVISQRDLVRTEFYTDFMRPERNYWGLNVYFFDGQTSLGDFRIWRTRERGNFDVAELELMRLIEPAVTRALGALGGSGASVELRPPTEASEAVLQQAAGLSAREAQVAWLVCSGCSDKQVARALGVQHATVRFHLARVFRKLRVGSRVALVNRLNELLAVHRPAPSK